MRVIVLCGEEVVCSEVRMCCRCLECTFARADGMYRLGIVKRDVRYDARIWWCMYIRVFNKIGSVKQLSREQAYKQSNTRYVYI